MALAGHESDCVLATLAFGQVEQLIVLCHARVAPSDADWDLWLTHARERRYTALLIWSLGGVPNARQRAQVASTTRSDSLARPRTVLLSDSLAQRHIVTAFGWLLGERQPMRAFAPDDVEAALAWLQVAPPVQHVRATLTRLSLALDAGAESKRASRWSG
jgi:hypothetical protein